MDKFGFETQGRNYARFRPTYPISLLHSVLQHTKGKGRYLDVATGTGQLLLQLAPHFQSSTGVDLSPKMISSLKQDPLYLKHQSSIHLKVGPYESAL
jgi:SAM-dependent methyltransferase